MPTFFWDADASLVQLRKLFLGQKRNHDIWFFACDPLAHAVGIPLGIEQRGHVSLESESLARDEERGLPALFEAVTQRVVDGESGSPVAAPVTLLEGELHRLVVIVRGAVKHRLGDTEAVRNHGEIGPRQIDLHSEAGQRCQQDPAHATGAQHLAEPLVAHFVAVEPERGKLVATRLGSFRGPGVKQPQERRGRFLPAIGGGKCREKGEGGALLNRVTPSTARLHERGNIRVGPVAHLVGDCGHRDPGAEGDAGGPAQTFRNRRH